MLDWLSKHNVKKFNAKTFNNCHRTLGSVSVLMGVTVSILSGSVVAQDEPANSNKEERADRPVLEEVVVSATRRALQNALDIKRDSKAVVDVLSAGDIGDIPSLSVAEALEGIPGAMTHRLKGSGSQVSLRGMGPFLGFSTFNGREVTTGSADRSVNFQQFPSELISNITIYKTQQADLVEGGTSGTVNLGTVRPLDYGKPALSIDVRGKYNEHAARVEGNNGFGHRESLSWINQFDTDIGEIGVAVGYARFDSGNPEESYLTSSNWRLCDATKTNEPKAECAKYNRSSQAADLADNGQIDADLYAIPNSITYRTLDEYERRDAVISSFQWRPSDEWDIGLDLQLSDKRYEEDRHDIQLADANRGLSNVVTNGNFGLLSYSGTTRLRNDGELYRRDESYKGGGLNFVWTGIENLELSGDVSYSGTRRDRVRRYARFRNGKEYVNYNWVKNALVPSVTFTDPDLNINDFSPYRQDDFRLRTRITNRKDDIWATRFDAKYDFDDGFITRVSAGIRYSEHQRVTNNEDNREMSLSQINSTYWNGKKSEDELYAMALSCADSKFPNDDFFGSDDGGPNVGGSFATVDTQCVISALTDGNYSSLFATPGQRAKANDIDITESITAIYAMADFESDLIGLPVYGNFGVRVVETKVDSKGLRTTLDIVMDNDSVKGDQFSLEEVGNISISDANSFTEVLPSANVIVELQEDLLFRTAISRSLSRDNIELLGAGRDFDIDDTKYASKEELLANAFDDVSGGNPKLEPLMAWNADIGLEWYPNEDTGVAGAIYYKSLEAQVEQITNDENYVVDGENLAIPVSQFSVRDDKSDLWGFEMSVQHAFSYLPQPFDGLGTKLTYNYVQTNFETQDALFGDRIVNGQFQEGIRGIVPASIFGLSEHTGSFTVYWDIGPVNLQAIAKYRDEYFQPNAGDPKASRWIEEFTLVDLSATWKIDDTYKVRFTAQNVFDEPQTGHRVTRDQNLTLWSSTGPKYELGITASFF